MREFRIPILELGDPLDLVAPGGLVKERPVQLPAVYLRDVLDVHELRQHWYNVVVAEDEDLGHGDGIEPALDPPPHSTEESGGADDEDPWSQ